MEDGSRGEDNLTYLETMAEAMHNLHSESRIEGKEEKDPADLYSMNKPRKRQVRSMRQS